MNHTQLQNQLQLKVKELSKLNLTAEKIVLNILETNPSINLSKVRIKYLGNFKRANNKDVESIFVDQKTGDVLININRNGLYDQLPKGLFHALSRRRNLASINTMLQDGSRLKKEEEDARHFFEPFEQSLFAFELSLASKERNSAISLFMLQALLTIDDKENLDIATRDYLLSSFPMLHNVQLLDHKISKLLSDCFQKNITVEKTFRTINVKHSRIMKLGKSKIGDNHYLDQHISLPQSIYIIKIKDLQKEELKSFLPTGRNEVMLRHLCKYLLPASVEIRIKPVLNMEDSKCKLNQMLQPIMGISTILN